MRLASHQCKQQPVLSAKRCYTWFILLSTKSCCCLSEAIQCDDTVLYMLLAMYENRHSVEYLGNVYYT